MSPIYFMTWKLSCKSWWMTIRIPAHNSFSTIHALLYDNLKLGVICYFYALSIKIFQGWPRVDDNCKIYYKKRKKGFTTYFTLKKRWTISMDRTVHKSLKNSKEYFTWKCLKLNLIPFVHQSFYKKKRPVHSTYTCLVKGK